MISLDFDAKTLKPRKKPEVKEKFLPDSVKGRCLAVSPDKEIVVGCKDGSVRIIDNKFRPRLCSKLSKK